MKRVLPVLAGALVLATCFALPQLSGYKVDASTDSMVLEDDPLSIYYDRTTQMFVSDEFVLVGVRRADLFEPSGVAAIGSLHSKFAAIAFVGTEITPDSPAVKAGLRVRDRIVQLGEVTEVRYHTLPEILQQAATGEPVPLVVRSLNEDGRTTTRRELQITLPALAPDALMQAVTGAADEADLKQRREAFVREHLGAHYAEAVQGVLSIARAPLFRSHDPPVMPIQALMQQASLGSPQISAEKAYEELTDSELFANNIISRDGKAAGVLVTLRPLPESRVALSKRLRILDRRALAREAIAAAKTPAETAAGQAELAQAQAELEAFRPEWVRTEDLRKAERIRIIMAIREIVNEARAEGMDIRASGVPALVVEMVEAIDGDLRTFFGLAVLFVFGFLAAVFRHPRWVLLPLLATGATVVWTIVLMFAFGKRITVITSNVPSLLLVIGLAHSIHMIVRYRELLVLHPDAEPRELVKRMVRSLVWPCLFTATTTGAGFLSLQYAGSRPIIDFGVLMSLGVALAFMVSFVVLPGFLLALGRPKEGRLERSARFLQGLGGGSLKRKPLVLGAAALITILSVVGISRLDVEARFIDYFSPDSPIHKGLTYIDENLGGTSGLEVILTSEEQGTFGALGTPNLDRAAEVVAWLEEQPEVGVVMSFPGLADEIQKAFPTVDRGRAGGFAASQIDASLVKPYVLTQPVHVAGRDYPPYSAVRIAARVRETDKDLDRNALLERLHAFLAERFPEDGSCPDGVDPETFVKIEARTTGMFVLYASMLQSLIGSQIKTSIIAVVVIWLMLALLFRNPFAAFLALIPNALPIAFVIGAMGWAKIPLDMATVMIASVSLGIGIDCAIHYLFRYREEVRKDGDVAAAIVRSHGSIGTSILYTSLTTVVGFSVLALSNFRPNAYFGVLTGFAMIAALFAMLTVLPVLIAIFKPFGKEMREGQEAADGAKEEPVPEAPAPEEPATEEPDAPDPPEDAGPVEP